MSGRLFAEHSDCASIGPSRASVGEELRSSHEDRSCTAKGGIPWIRQASILRYRPTIPVILRVEARTNIPSLLPLLQKCGAPWPTTSGERPNRDRLPSAHGYAPRRGRFSRLGPRLPATNVQARGSRKRAAGTFGPAGVGRPGPDGSRREPVLFARRKYARNLLPPSPNLASMEAAT